MQNKFLICDDCQGVNCKSLEKKLTKLDPEEIEIGCRRIVDRSPKTFAFVNNRPLHSQKMNLWKKGKQLQNRDHEEEERLRKRNET